MTNEAKIKEIEQKHRFQSDWLEEALQEMAEWKDEQWKKRLQDAFMGAWTASLDIENNNRKRTTTISFVKVDF